MIQSNDKATGNIDEVVFIYHYFRTKGPPILPRLVIVRHTRETLAPILEKFASFLDEMRQMRELPLSAIPRNTDACWDFGGCHFRGQCYEQEENVLTEEQIMSDTGINFDDLLSSHAAAQKLSVSLGEATVSGMEALSAKIKETLEAAGITTVAALRAMTREQLLELEGIGEKTADKILEAAQAAGQETPESAEEAAQAAAQRELEASVKSNLLSREPKSKGRADQTAQSE